VRVLPLAAALTRVLPAVNPGLQVAVAFMFSTQRGAYGSRHCESWAVPTVFCFTGDFPTSIFTQVVVVAYQVLFQQSVITTQNALSERSLHDSRVLGINLALRPEGCRINVVAQYCTCIP
jgi:hypothetical protein